MHEAKSRVWRRRMTETCPSKGLVRRPVPVTTGPTVSVIRRGNFSEASFGCHRSDNKASK